MATSRLHRRTLLTASAALALTWPLRGTLSAQQSIPIGDMHRHLFFNRLRSGESAPFGQSMASGNATLVAWALTTDVLWITRGPRGYVQSAVPAVGESFGFFQRELARIRQHLAEEKLKIVQTPDAVAAALAGTPHVVLATEGTLFLEEDLSRLQFAHSRGVRQIQLVHYTRNPVADFQTARPDHGGLTDFGRRVIAEGNRLGMLVDLAHCTERAVDQALEVSRAPMIWSHSSIAGDGAPDWTMVGWKARQLTLACAQRIARKGGVIGLWGFRVDAGQSIEAYAERLLAMADQIGEEHVAFGTDMNAIPADRDFSLLSSYADLRKVVEHWQRNRVPDGRIRKIAIGNFARVLADALRPRPNA